MSTSPLDIHTLGRTGIEVTALCLGTSPLGSMPQLYGHSVEKETAIATVDEALDRGIRAIDTSNSYGGGNSEQIVGEALRRRGGLPDGVLLATKVDPAPGSSDFSGARVLASFEESLERLGVDRIELLHLHDPEKIGFEASMAEGGPVEALIALRDSGRVDYLGVAGGPTEMLTRFIETDVFDAVLSHNRFSLLDRSAHSLFKAASARGIGVINAAPFGGGMLAKGPAERPTYAYGRGDDSMGEYARRMAEACGKYGVELASAALQFSLRAPIVDMTVVGGSRPSRIDAAMREVDIPHALWEELETLAPPPTTWMG
ncbi:aldo/keto reductase [Georgenia deserti]|uniref:Aldo/keto reductase n=1 Tax=Georgenia deserti TaxID=2093781 RepID=A0ABW4KZH2_9MICO